MIDYSITARQTPCVFEVSAVAVISQTSMHYMRSDRHFGGSFLKLGIQRKKARRYNLWTPRVRMPHQILSTLSPLNSLETSATLGQNNPVKRSSMESNRATMATTTVQVDVCIRWRVESYNWRRKEEKNRERGGETSLAGCVFLTGN